MPGVRRGTLGKLQFASIILIALIGLPVYLFRTRGLRGFLSLLLALLYYLLIICEQFGVMMITDLLV